MSATAVVCRTLELCAIVDSGGPIINHDLHPDAERVHELVLGFPQLEGSLLIHFGRTGAAPDWMPGARPGYQLKIDERGKPVKIYDQNRRWTGAFAIEVRLYRETLERARQLHRAWWDAVAEVHATLVGEGWRDLKGPLDEREPWLTWCGV